MPRVSHGESRIMKCSTYHQIELVAKAGKALQSFKKISNVGENIFLWPGYWAKKSTEMYQYIRPTEHIYLNYLKITFTI